MLKVSDTINYEAGRALAKLMEKVDNIVVSMFSKEYRRDFYKSLFVYLTVEQIYIKNFNPSILVIGDQYLKILDLFKEKVNQKDKIGIEELLIPLRRLALLTAMSDKISKTTFH